jgi:uncharacterized protein (TIGR03083 family)
MDLDFQLASIEADARHIAAVTRAAPDRQVPSCPDWTGRDLLAHVSRFTRLLPALLEAGGAQPDSLPDLTVEEAAADYDENLQRMIATMRATPPDAPAFTWSVAAPVAGFWSRRAVHELAVHRWDADTITTAEPAPVPTEVAVDGIAEFFEVFVRTGLAAGMVPPAAVTLVLEITDTGQRQEHPLPEPGPQTTLRGTASDLLLAVWRRHDPLAHHADGDPTVLAAWPSI